MRGYSKQVYIKLFLILVSEGLAVVLTDLVSQYIVPIEHTNVSYMVCGSLLAVVVVTLYDRFLLKRKCAVKRELQDITDAALMRYHVQDENRK